MGMARWTTRFSIVQMFQIEVEMVVTKDIVLIEVKGLKGVNKVVLHVTTSFMLFKRGKGWMRRLMLSPIC